MKANLKSSLIFIKLSLSILLIPLLSLITAIAAFNVDIISIF